MKKITAIGLALSAAVLSTSCAGVSASPASAPPAGDNRPGIAETAPEPPISETASAATPPAMDDGLEQLGSAYTWDDGLSVTVSTPAPYKPSEYAAGHEGFDTFIVLDVTVVNRTGRVWDPSMFMATVQSANQEGSQIFDSENLPAKPSTKLLDGREVTFKLAFGVADSSDLVVEVTPDFEHQSVLFHN